MAYYYAYHSNANDADFTDAHGYGISDRRAARLEQVNVGDLLFVIQNVRKERGYQLCGLYRIDEKFKADAGRYPNRVALSVVSANKDFITLDQHALSKRLPVAGKEERWNRFMNHFVQQGRSFQNPLTEPVISLLLEQLKNDEGTNEDIPAEQEAVFLDRVNRALKESQQARLKRLKTAPVHPVKKQETVWRYDRNPDVVAEVLYRAKGVCECCKKEAPFTRLRDGSNYLEVHHIVPLSAGGEDNVKNCIAVCPNCHRQEHYGNAQIDPTWLPD